jgi:putative ABC transport system permease protein
MQPIASVESMDDILDHAVADRLQQTMLLTAFGSLAVLLASVWLYGVLAYAVTECSREIGLRIALGATGRSVVTMIVGRGLALTAPAS